jgi:hypothetical protein
MYYLWRQAAAGRRLQARAVAGYNCSRLQEPGLDPCQLPSPVGPDLITGVALAGQWQLVHFLSSSKGF